MNVEKRKFAAFDIDGTVFRWQLYHELFDALGEAGIVDAHDLQNVIDAREKWSARNSSFSEYEEVLVEAMERIIVGLPETRVNELARQILSSKGQRTYAYTRKLMHDLKAAGYVIVVISGSYQQLVEPFAELHNVDIAIGSGLEIIEGKITRKSRGIVGHKDVFLKQIVEEHDLTWDDSYAVGDSGGDIAMLELVAHPIAFNPDDKLFAVASRHDWKVVVERKNMIYELEGEHGSYLLASANPR